MKKKVQLNDFEFESPFKHNSWQMATIIDNYIDYCLTLNKLQKVQFKYNDL